MEFFSLISDFLASLPWWSVLVPPAVLVLCWIPLAIFRKRRPYLWLTFFCLVAEGLSAFGSGHFLLIVLLFTAIAVILYPFFFLPQRKRKSHGEELKRFEEETERPFPEKKYPPKVCCFEQPRGETAEERGMKLSHVISLLEKLKNKKLTPADRLEVEMLSRSVEGAEARPLTDGQTDELSDNLSAVLRLMAKYS